MSLDDFHFPFFRDIAVDMLSIRSVVRTNMERQFPRQFDCARAYPTYSGLLTKNIQRKYWIVTTIVTHAGGYSSHLNAVDAFMP